MTYKRIMNIMTIMIYIQDRQENHDNHNNHINHDNHDNHERHDNHDTDDTGPQHTCQHLHSPHTDSQPSSFLTLPHQTPPGAATFIILISVQVKQGFPPS